MIDISYYKNKRCVFRALLKAFEAPVECVTKNADTSSATTARNSRSYKFKQDVLYQ